MIDAQKPLRTVKQLAMLDCPRNRMYQQGLDHSLETFLATFNLDQLPFGDPQTSDTRTATDLTGRMAFAWASPLSRYHRDPRLLAHVRARLMEFAKNQAEGAIYFRKAETYWQWPNYDGSRDVLGVAWYVEPLAMAAVWIGDELTDAEKAIIKTMVRRAADLICALPFNRMNNAGAVRCAVLCLLGHYLEDRNYIDLGIADFHREPLRIFNPRDGQINEGAGPDANYSGTSYIYCYLYRVFSNDVSIDQAMADGARWYARVADAQGCPTYMGASTRVAIVGPGKVLDFLPAFERYTAAHPHLSWLIENSYRATIAGSDNGHAVSPLIWAMLEHDGKPPVADPKWFDYPDRHGPEFGYVEEGHVSLYYVFREDYQATTTLVGRAPYQGLQNWAYKLEPPVVWPTATHASTTRAWGIDTATQHASGTKFFDRRWIHGPPHVFIDRFHHVWHHYLFTRTTMLYLVSTDHAPREDLWVIAKQRCGTPVVDGQCVRYADRQGRMHFAQPPPQVKELANAWHLTFAGKARTNLYAFGNESFELLEFAPDGDLVRFRDDTGSYELKYELRFYAYDDLIPIGEKGFGQNDITKYVAASARKL